MLAVWRRIAEAALKRAGPGAGPWRVGVRSGADACGSGLVLRGPPWQPRGMRRLAPLAVVPLALLSALLLSGCTARAPETSTGDPIGRWGSMADDQPHVEFSEGGSVAYHDGCNGGGGSWSQADPATAVVVGGMSATFMACPGEQPFLAGTDTAIVDGDAIHLLDGGGEVIEVLRRAS